MYVAPTVTDPTFLPGLPIVFNSGPSLPAAVTTKISLSNAWSTALSILEFVLFIPKLILIISAPSSTALLIALTINSDETPSPSSETLYAKIFAFGATPCACPSAAITPATWVPWPFVSIGNSPSLTKLYPPITFPSSPHPNKSGWVKSTPVSITAILIPSPSIPWIFAIPVPMYGALLSR